MANEWLKNMLGKARFATSDAELAEIEKEAEQHIKTTDENSIHLHLGGGGGSMGGKDEIDPGNEDPDMGDGGVEDRVATLEQEVMELKQIVSDLTGGEEEEVDLEDPETKDSRRYVMRRGAKMKARDADEDLPVPERRPEIMGETDLPGIEDLDGKKTSDRKKLLTRDSADQEVLWEDTVALGAIITPDIRVPTFDARLPMGRTAQRLCSFRRQVMDKALGDEDTATIIADVVGIKTKDSLKNMTCDTLKMAFNATASAMKTQNNSNMVRRSVDTSAKAKDGGNSAGAPSIAEMQKRQNEYWNARINGSR